MTERDTRRAGEILARSAARDEAPASPVCPYCGDGMDSVGTLNHIECVRALTERIAELEDDLADAAKTCGGLEYRLETGGERLKCCANCGWMDWGPASRE